MRNKGKMPSLLMFAAALAAALCQGCSIKEDRSLCPCSLVLDFSGTDLSAADMAGLYIRADDGFLYYDDDVSPDILYEDSGDGLRMTYEVRVPKTSVMISGILGAGRMFTPETGLLIPLGYECPEIFMHYSEVDASGERLEEKMVFHKDYCRITVRMLTDSEDYPFSLTVTGNANGLKADRSVTKGDFSVSFVPDSSGSGTVCVPRQADNGLVLRILDEDKILREFALGEYIAESGYDWSAENLDDVEISIDYAHSFISIEVDDWTGSFEYDVVI